MAVIVVNLVAAAFAGVARINPVGVVPMAVVVVTLVAAAFAGVARINATRVIPMAVVTVINSTVDFSGSVAIHGVIRLPCIGLSRFGRLPCVAPWLRFAVHHKAVRHAATVDVIEGVRPCNPDAFAVIPRAWGCAGRCGTG
jgi:hypothetical protein